VEKSENTTILCSSFVYSEFWKLKVEELIKINFYHYQSLTNHRKSRIKSIKIMSYLSGKNKGSSRLIYYSSIICLFKINFNTSTCLILPSFDYADKNHHHFDSFITI
jgi:hypothetical protein